MKTTHSFQDFSVRRGRFKVTWEYMGEGWNGDYDKNDPNDDPLLRFSCDWSDGFQWQEVRDGSYCTHCPIDTPRATLERFAQAILDACEQPSPKRRLEELSWLCPEDDKHNRNTHECQLATN